MAEPEHANQQPEVVESEAGRAQAAWGYSNRQENHWPATLAILTAMFLYLFLPEKLTYFPRWVFPALEGALIIPLTFLPHHHHRRAGERPWRRMMALTLIAIINAANFLSLGLLIANLLSGHAENGVRLISSSLIIWVTSVITFGLWYWELDRGGPSARCMVHHRQPDFLFPQMTNPEVAPDHWTPGFLDYLYVSLTNAMAFSPTDTMPLTAWAKSLMGVQAMASLLTIALVAARAVNILH